jgi:hypothetical protein
MDVYAAARWSTSRWARSGGWWPVSASSANIQVTPSIRVQARYFDGEPGERDLLPSINAIYPGSRISASAMGAR